MVLLLLLGACRGKGSPEKELAVPPVQAEGYANPMALIEASELRAMEGEPGVRVIDFRPQSEFEKGHIPGAIPLWRSDIESSDQQTPGMIASKAHMEGLLSGKGISNDDLLILYDDQGGVNAARLWWVLKVYGFENVRLLNGGLQGWENEKAPLTLQNDINPVSSFEFSGTGMTGLRIERDSVLALLGDPAFVLVDVRTTDEFTGKRLKSGARSAGRIPGSLHIDWADAVYYNGNRKFRTFEELKKIYKKLPEDRDAHVITYCHSGVRSAHTTFVLTQLLGYRQVHNYDGSWLEWSSFDGAPVEKDSLTTILE